MNATTMHAIPPSGRAPNGKGRTSLHIVRVIAAGPLVALVFKLVFG